MREKNTMLVNFFFRKKDMKKFFSSPFRPGQKHRKRVNSATQKRKDEQQ